jgi:hypothetical protein
MQPRQRRSAAEDDAAAPLLDPWGGPDEPEPEFEDYSDGHDFSDYGKE